MSEHRGFSGETGQVTTSPGRRELAKQDTRRAIRQAAMQLFLRDGFDMVTTTEVAVTAGVSPATLFNYFATKEDLFFGQVTELEGRLIAVVRGCAPGESILAALQANVLHELTAGRHRTNPAAVASFHHEVARSQQLQAREHEIYDRRETVLAVALIDALDGHADPLPARTAAALYVAAEKLIATELRRLLERTSPAAALRRIRPFVDGVFGVLATGLGDVNVPRP
jgi:AcrR family transcriptional regulator